MSIRKQQTPGRAGIDAQDAGRQGTGAHEPRDGQDQGLRRPDDDQLARQALDPADLDEQSDLDGPGEPDEGESGDLGGRGTPGTGDVRSDGNDDEDNERR